MKRLTLKKIPEPCLRKKAAAVTTVTDQERTLLAAMAATMYETGGVGLAATQVGINQQLAVVDVGDGLIKLINPSIVKREGAVTQEEGCLSVPETIIPVKRAASVRVSFLTEEGEVSELRATGLLARAIQHEIDHLAGKLIIDYAHPLKRLVIAGKRAISRRAP